VFGRPPPSPELEAQLVGELHVRRLQQVRAVGEDDRGDRPAAVLELLDEAEAFGVGVDVDPGERDALLLEEGLRATAVGAPRRPVDGTAGAPRRM
jgi:hypothetical protein